MYTRSEKEDIPYWAKVTYYVTFYQWNVFFFYFQSTGNAHLVVAIELPLNNDYE